MRDRIDIMTDIETLGTNEEVAIIQLSAVAFDIRTKEVISTFNEYVNIEKSFGMKIDGSTLKWWLKTNKELFAEIINNENALPLLNVLTKFYEWVRGLDSDNKAKYLWGNGILFDNRIIQEAMRKHGLEYPIFYRNDRDMRTIVELACMKKNVTIDELKNEVPMVGTVHNAFDDTMYQIELLHYCYKILV